MLLGSHLQAPAGGARHHPRSGRLLDPRLRIEDQPHGVGTGELQDPRRRGPADALRHHRRGGAGRPCSRSPGGQRRGLVAQLRRRPAQLVPDLRRSGGRRLPHPRLRSPVRARPAADRGLRPRGRRARHAGRIARPTSTGGSRCAWSGRSTLVSESAPRVPRRARRGRAAPPVRRPRGDARTAPAPHRDLRAARTYGCRSCRSASAATPARAAPSRSCSFPESDLSDVVYLEQLTSALYLDKREDVAQYERAMKELQQDSPGPDESRDLLRGLLQLS